MIAVILLLNAVLFGLEALDTEALEIVVAAYPCCACLRMSAGTVKK